MTYILLATYLMHFIFLVHRALTIRTCRSLFQVTYCLSVPTLVLHLEWAHPRRRVLDRKNVD